VDYHQLFLDNLPVVDEVVRFVGWRHRLSAEEAEDLASDVRLKLLENDYAVFRKFQGRSSLRSYLAVVAQRCFLDWRIARWGKWRPSAAARRLGPLAVLLERLLARDGHTYAEAVQIIQTRHLVDITIAELDRMRDQLPLRAKRHHVPEECLGDLPADDPQPLEMLEHAADQAESARVERALEQALALVSGDDRLLLQLRFEHGLQLAQIARLVHVDQKLLYRRFDRLLKLLRQELEAQGLRAESVLHLCGDPTFAFDAVISASPAEPDDARPSKPMRSATSQTMGDPR
jgi:RNA polymerase sigma factor (sigma-70 family)